MQKAFLPARFAAYIALSACAISVAASPASSGKMLTPRLAEQRALTPPIELVGLEHLGRELADHALDRGRVLHLLEHDEEFVAAQARHDVARAQAAAGAATSTRKASPAAWRACRSPA